VGCENSPLRLCDFSHLLSLWQRYLFKSLLDTCTTFGDGARRSAVLANTLAHVAVMRPDPQSGAMRDLVAKLLDFDDVNRFIGEMTSGISTRYDLGSELDDVKGDPSKRIDEIENVETVFKARIVPQRSPTA
jgi:hypothetical protein